MSSFINKGYYCIDDFFGHHEYGCVKMTEEEKSFYANYVPGQPSAWTLLDFKTLEGRGGTREVLRSIPNL